MAENEILDVARSKRWLPIRNLLRADNFDGQQITECVEAQMRRYIKKALQGNSLYEILKAASVDSAALRTAVANCKEQDLARVVRAAIHLSPSNASNVVAKNVVELMCSRLDDAFRVYCHEQVPPDRQLQIQTAIRAGLSGCERELTDSVERALTNPSLRDRRRVRRAPTPENARINSKTSLLDRSRRALLAARRP